MRYMIRMLELGSDTVKERIEGILGDADLKFINIWIALKEGKCSGFGFIEAHNEGDIDLIMNALASNGISCEKY